MSGIFRNTILAAVVLGLLLPFAARASSTTGIVDSLTSAQKSLAAAKPDQAGAALGALIERLGRDESRASKELQRRVRFVALTLSTGDLQGARSGLETLIQEVGAPEKSITEPKASVTAIADHVGGQGEVGQALYWGGHWRGYGRHWHRHHGWGWLRLLTRWIIR